MIDWLVEISEMAPKGMKGCTVIIEASGATWGGRVVPRGR